MQKKQKCFGILQSVTSVAQCQYRSFYRAWSDTTNNQDSVLRVKRKYKNIPSILKIIEIYVDENNFSF